MLKTQENKYVYAYVQRAHNYVQSNEWHWLHDNTHGFLFCSTLCLIYPGYSILNPQITSKAPANPHNNPVR